MVDIGYFVGSCGDFLIAHAFHHNKGEASLTEVILEYILTHHSVYILWQIGEYIVIYTGVKKSENRRYQKKYTYNKYENSVPCYPFT